MPGQLTTVEKVAGRASKKSKSGSDATAKLEVETAERAEQALSEGRWLWDEDWTPEIRATASVREYVLFWELRGTTGGRSAFAPNPGWRPRDLVEVEEYLVGRTDEGLPHIGLTQYTRATAFTRVEG